MRTGVAGLFLCVAGAALAQQEDPVERQVQRYKDQLNLTEDQQVKIRELLRRQQEDFRAVLTDEQKTLYDEQLRRFGGRGNFVAGGPGIGRGGWLPSSDELKKPLGLSDEQAAKIDEVRDLVRQEMRAFAQENRGQARNPDDWQKFMEKVRDEAARKVRDLLTEEQKPKFDELLKSSAVPQTGPGRPGQSLEDRLKRVMESLKIEKDAEAEAIRGVVRRVLEALDKVDSYQRESRSKLDELVRNQELSDEAVGDRIEELRKGSRDLEKALGGARKELAEIVTNRQELELIRRGILK
jgi:hypothetical protein